MRLCKPKHYNDLLHERCMLNTYLQDQVNFVDFFSGENIITGWCFKVVNKHSVIPRASHMAKTMVSPSWQSKNVILKLVYFLYIIYYVALIGTFPLIIFLRKRVLRLLTVSEYCSKILILVRFGFTFNTSSREMLNVQKSSYHQQSPV